MIDGTYQVVAKTPLGRKKGTVELVSNGGQVDAVATALRQTFRASGTCDGESFGFEGEVKVLSKRAHYRMEGRVVGNKLQATAYLAGREVAIVGERLG